MKASPQERKPRAQHLSEAVLYMYNFCSFGGAFGCEKLPEHYLHKELFDPVLLDLWKQLGDAGWCIVDAGHKTGSLKRNKLPWKQKMLSAEICGELTKVKKADENLLDIVKQAIAILEQGDK
jgi:hypothetical protein